MNLIRQEEINAEVEPFPLVPAIWIALRLSKSEGYGMLDLSPAMFKPHSSLVAYLIANLFTPFDHLWYSLPIHHSSRLSDCVHDCEIRLKAVERCDGILSHYISATSFKRHGAALTLYVRLILGVVAKLRD